MRFTFKEDQNLNTNVIREEFLERYYPEMETKEMRFVNIFSPITDYIRLQKNFAVTAYFRVKQDPDNNATHIYISEGVTKRSVLLGADFWNFLIRGDFYDDLNRKFNEWLMKKYDFTKDQITLTNPWSHTWLFINSLLWAILIVAVLVFLFDQVYQSVNLVMGHDFTPWQEFLYNLPTGRRFNDIPIILIMFAAFFGVIYYFKKRRKEEREEKIEYFTGMKIQPYQPKWRQTFIEVFSLLLCHAVAIFLFLFIAFEYDSLIRFDHSGITETKTYELREDGLDGNDVDGYSIVYSLYHKPTNKVVYKSNDYIGLVSEENGYAIIYAEDENNKYGYSNSYAYLYGPKGTKVLDKKYSHIYFVTSDIIEADDEYLDLNGNPTGNYKTYLRSHPQITLFIMMGSMYVLLVTATLIWNYIWKRKKRIE